MANKSEQVTPEEGVFFMHIDDFLNLTRSEIKNSTGQVHAESIAAFARSKKGVTKQPEQKWRSEFQAFLTEVPK